MFTLSFVLVTIEINDLVLFHQIFILPSVFAMYGFFTFSDFDTTFISKCEWNKKSQGLLTTPSPWLWRMARFSLVNIFKKLPKYQTYAIFTT